MGDVMPYRGPDDRGLWRAPGVGLGHLRLSIIDLSSAGHQPMSTSDGRYTIVYNGEIYNYLELRSELEAKGHIFRSNTDTEVILAMYREVGSVCVERFNGMFAFALYDTADHTLFLARDRLGIKPLYYASTRNGLIFGSEMKAILSSGMVERRPNYRAVYQYVRHMYTTDHETFFEGIHRLLPGQRAFATRDGFRVERYWDLPMESEPELSAPVSQYAEQLRDIVDDSVRLRLRSDVPVGCYLSGGIDSSSIVSLAQPRLGGMHSFSLSFDEGPAFDESRFVEMVRDQYPTDHHPITPTMRESWDMLPNVVWWLDEPVVASPTVSQYFLSKIAREHVTVCLGGQGGDELFGGYYRFFPRYLKGLMRDTALGRRSPADLWPTFRNFLGHLKTVGLRQVAVKMSKHSSMMDMVGAPILDAHHDTEAGIMNDLPMTDPMNRMLYWEVKNYLPGLLHAEDRMSMSVSLESRVPLLDHRLVEMAARIPPELKMRHLVTKYILRESMRGITPDPILDRMDKRGTPGPLVKWFAGDLADDVAGVLLDRRTVERGLFDAKLVERALAEHKVKGSYGEQIWMLLNVEMWHRTFIDAGSDMGPISL
jgi:asparagine synthase (glutamine-hydrolysing)